MSYDAFSSLLTALIGVLTLVVGVVGFTFYREMRRVEDYLRSVNQMGLVTVRDIAFENFFNAVDLHGGLPSDSPPQQNVILKSSSYNDNPKYHRKTDVVMITYPSEWSKPLPTLWGAFQLSRFAVYCARHVTLPRNRWFARWFLHPLRIWTKLSNVAWAFLIGVVSVYTHAVLAKVDTSIAHLFTVFLLLKSCLALWRFWEGFGPNAMTVKMFQDNKFQDNKDLILKHKKAIQSYFELDRKADLSKMLMFLLMAVLLERFI